MKGHGVRRIAGVLVLALGGHLAAQQTGSPGTSVPAFRGGVSVVAVDVSVLVRREPVTGLTADDFVVLDNGVPQRIQAVSRGSVPLDVSVLIDVSGSVSGWQQQLQRLVPDIARQLLPDDRYQVIAFGNGVRKVVTMRSPLELGEPLALPDVRGTALHDALFLSMTHEPGLERRHVVVAFTDGSDTTSVIDADRLARLAATSEASIHLVAIGPNSGNPRPVGMSLPPARTPPAPIARAVAVSGGRVHVPLVPSLPDAIRQVLADYRTRYVVRYSPTGVASAGWHTLEVRVPRVPDASIQARKGYAVDPVR